MNQQYSVQSIANTHLANVEAIRSLASTAMNAAERLLSLNLEFARASLSAGTDSAQIASKADWKQLSSQPGAAFQNTTEKAVAYFRNVYDIATETQAEVSELVSSRVGTLGDSMTSMLDMVSQSAPAGSEKAMAVMKSAVANACSVYSMLSKTAQQAAEVDLSPRKAKKAA